VGACPPTAARFSLESMGTGMTAAMAPERRGEEAHNNALKLTKPIQERAPRHSASHHGAPCRSARSSLMRASQLIAVFGRHGEGTSETAP
jgi:hypothetical protein